MLDGCSSTWLLNLFICLQYSNNDFGDGDVSCDVLYVPRGEIDLLRVVFMVAWYTKRTKKMLLEVLKV